MLAISDHQRNANQTTMRSTPHPLDWQSSKREIMTSVDKKGEKLEPKDAAGGDEKQRPLWKKSGLSSND